MIAGTQARVGADLALRPNGEAWLAAGLGLAVLCTAFVPEIASAVSVWNSSTAYGHCWLVLPIAAFLLWERRASLAIAPGPAIWPVLLAVPLACLWGRGGLARDHGGPATCVDRLHRVASAGRIRLAPLVGALAGASLPGVPGAVRRLHHAGAAAFYRWLHHGRAWRAGRAVRG